MAELTIQLGAMCPSLVDQLKGTKAPKAMVKKWDKYADAITLLSIKGLITESEAHNARKKLVKNFIRKTTL